MGEKKQRVPQDKEQEHFLEIFQGKFHVKRGKQTQHDAAAPHLYCVKGDSAALVHPVEVECASYNLNSLHSFVLDTPAMIIVWNGRLSNAHEKIAASNFANSIKVTNREKEKKKEKPEPDEGSINRRQRPSRS